VISDEDGSIAVGGFGIELDCNNEDICSFNLNSGLLSTPPRKKGLSSPHKSDKKLDDFFAKEINSEGGSNRGFELQVEAVPTIQASDFGNHFENLKTLNSGGSNSNAARIVLQSAGSRNPHSMQVNSLSNVDDSTLQLDTIGATKTRMPTSTKNSLLGRGPDLNQVLLV